MHNFGKKNSQFYTLLIEITLSLLLVPRMTNKADLDNPNSFAINLIACLFALPSSGATVTSILTMGPSGRFPMRTRFADAFGVTRIGRVDFPELSHFEEVN